MKHIKLYEELNDKPKVGDYVVCYDKIYKDKDKRLNDFLLNNVGQCYDDLSDDDTVYQSYQIFYEKIPQELNIFFNSGKNFRWMKSDEILFYSKNMEDCLYFIEMRLNLDKYNL